MKLNEVTVTRAILDTYFNKLRDYTDIDVVIAGGGPAGICAGYYLAKKGIKVAMFERKLSIGGGMWGGGMMFNSIVVQQAGKEILDEFGIGSDEYESGYYTADSIEAVTALTYKAVRAGLKIFNCMSVEDVMIDDKRNITGVVINWSAVEIANLHVDPLCIRSKYIVEATGHPCEVAKVIVRKVGKNLFTKTGDLMGEGSMNAEEGEKAIMDNTKEFYKNAYVAGMSCNAVFGAPRMGPVFGGMLLSGRKVAEIIASKMGK